MSFQEDFSDDKYQREFEPIRTIGIAVQYFKRGHFLYVIPYTDEFAHRLYINPHDETLDNVKLEIKRVFNFSDCNFKIYRVQQQKVISEITDISQFEKELVYEIVLNNEK